MEIFDYRQKISHINEVETKIDILTEGEAKQVSEFIDTLKEKANQEQYAQSVKWLNSAILPMLQDFAEITSSLLTLEQPDGFTWVITLINADGFDITESCRILRTFFNLAGHIGINSKEDETSLTFIFDCHTLK